MTSAVTQAGGLGAVNNKSVHMSLGSGIYEISVLHTEYRYSHSRPAEAQARATPVDHFLFAPT